MDSLKAKQENPPNGVSPKGSVVPPTDFFKKTE
jgi:hypothetical protein